MSCSCNQPNCTGANCSVAMGGAYRRKNKLQNQLDAQQKQLDKLIALMSSLHGAGATTMVQTTPGGAPPSAPPSTVPPASPPAPPSTVPPPGNGNGNGYSNGNGYNGYNGNNGYPEGCVQQSAVCTLCQWKRPGVADCDLDQWLQWACAGPQITTAGVAGVDGTPDLVWILDSLSTAVAHYYQVPHAGVVCLKTLTLEMDPAGGTDFVPLTGEFNVFLIPAEVAINPDGDEAGTWFDVRGRRGPRNSATLQVKDGRCECDVLCATCVWPVTANDLGGGYLLVIESMDGVPGFVPGTSTLRIGHRLLYWHPEHADPPCPCECPRPTLPCGRADMEECHPSTDLLALSKTQDNWTFCSP